MSTETTQPRTREVTQLDLTKPIWWTFYQTPSSHIWKPFTGKGAEKRAILHANERSKALGRQVAVFPPQTHVKSAVPAQVTDLDLNFAEGAE